MRFTFFAIAILFTSPSFAKVPSVEKATKVNLPPQNPGCGAIRNACKKAGYGSETEAGKALGSVRE
jgi:hypothetical protein